MKPVLLALTLIRQLDVEKASSPGRAPFVSAASSLVAVKDQFYIAADDELHLAIFPKDAQKKGHFVEIFREEALPLEKEARKKKKPDLEGLCFLPKWGAHGALLALPSGSKKNRVRGAVFPFEASGRLDGKVLPADFTEIYAALGKQFSELNIEGAVVHDGQLKLVQRGNGKSAQNGLIEVDLAGLLEDLQKQRAIQASRLRSVKTFDLGKLHNIRLGFSDTAVSADGELYALATTEDKDSTYEDGRFGGALLGKLDSVKGFTPVAELKIDAKPEGLAFSADGKEFWVVTDADDAAVAAKFYRARLP